MDGQWSQSRLLRVLGPWAHAGEQPLFRSLADGLRGQITTGRIPSGVRLPSERALASALGVSRSTVVAAFDQLRSEGLIASRQGSGTRVTRAGYHRSARGENRLDSFAEQPATAPSGIDLRSGALPGLSFVADTVAALTAADLEPLVARHGYSLDGLPELRSAIARYYTDLGLGTHAEQVLVTSGAQQALRLVASTLLEPGDVVIVEDPTFRGAIETLRASGVRLVPVASGRHGIDLGELDHALDTERVRMVFVQASGHNPTGSVLDPHRRAALAARCRQAGVLVVEDAAVADAIIDGEPLAPIAGPGGVITIGSASKNFWGGLRVGWLRADRALVEHLARAKGSEDLGTSLLAQVVTARLLTRIDEARAERRAALGRSRDAILEILDRELPDWEVSAPRAGASLWVRLPSGSATTFVQYATRHGVHVLPGPTFSARDMFEDHLRIAFSAPLDTVAAGVGRLARLWHGHGAP